MSKEKDAERIQVFTSSLIPGLLQIENCQDLFRNGLPSVSEAELNDGVAVRMRRKIIFEREGPPFYWAVMDEAALRRPFGGKEC